MKKIELNIPPQYLYFILISIFVVTFFGIIIYISSGEEGSAVSLPSPSAANFAEVLSAKSTQPPQVKNQPYLGIGPNPDEKYVPTPSPTPTPSPSPSPSLSPSPSESPTPTPTASPTESPSPTPSPT
ncbi:MAG: hypothetical protein ACD_30C00112G0057 [uncultured bacterium]|uniref:Uncharacterized protein n=4 Tax=Candidatus Daviesiibacteriota TaxID=1752718 RepID=A0A0G0EYB5_9BACT|nr:MAG: hypothetical protein ACD_30C00112G0057 [uncultured bacterium]KKQ10522.1 MAG: hypothetical protein US19_C0003G0017 [Candidatus Daviesbacteria bacterium GW2011_GWB1_36_5]KKQ14946.1 MAG: hypothetical protein US28_C0026G0024 [Candidatus Daviesbacteria bacterium GW2011_GWA1_36_8]OGE17217.1 MAG: hypothetical protein A2858_00740 [Candidatus Daviesbacteria bacterium RIFCSPHIGHO2_01_FULL_36_37]OGE35997.1 MAG: hypothetical protein A3E66_01735 [Candidatus Daviesbacteria bacterium RIFCSPHIGHO2_12_F